MKKEAFPQDPVTMELTVEMATLVGARLKTFCDKIKAGECIRITFPYGDVEQQGRPVKISMLARKYEGPEEETATYRVPTRTGNLAGKFQTILDAVGEHEKDGVIFSVTSPARVEIVFEDPQIS